MHSSWLTGRPRLFGLTFEGADETEDGTGINADDAAAAIIELPQKPVVRISMFHGIEPRTYVRIIRVLKEAGARILLLPVDSSEMAKLSTADFGLRHKFAAKVLGKELGPEDFVEVGNEISGERGDNRWPGPHAFEKAKNGLEAWSGQKAKKALTYFLTLDDLPWLEEWIAGHRPHLKVDLAGLSIYPFTIPNALIPWEEAFKLLAKYHPNTDLCVAEYGSEDANGKPGNADREDALVKLFEGRPRYHERDVGLNALWDAYRLLVRGPMLHLFQAEWKI